MQHQLYVVEFKSGQWFMVYTDICYCPLGYFHFDEMPQMPKNKEKL